MPTPVFVGAGAQVATANNVQNPTNLSPVDHASSALGHMTLLITCSRSNSATVATPSGWNLLTGFPVRSGTASGGTIYVFSSIVDGTASDTPTITWTGLATTTTGDSATARILSWSDGSTTQAGTVTSSDLSAVTTSWTAPAITTTGTDTLAVNVSIKVSDTAQTATITTFTERFDGHTTTGTGHLTVVGDKIQASAGSTGTGTVTPSSTTSSRVLTASLAMAAATATPANVVLASSPATSNATLALAVPAPVPLGTAVATSGATLDLTAPTGGGAAIGTPVAIGTVASQDSASPYPLTTTGAVPSGSRIFVRVGWLQQTSVGTITVSGGGLSWAQDHLQTEPGGGGGGGVEQGFTIWSADCPSGLASSTALSIALTTGGGGTRWGLGAVAFHCSGIASASRTDGATEALMAADVNWDATALTTTNADDLLVVSALGDGMGSAANTLDSPWVELAEWYDSGNAWGHTVGYRIVSSTGTYAAGGVWSAQPDFGGYSNIAAYKGEVVAGGEEVPLDPADGISNATLTLTAPTRVTLGSSPAQSNATLAVRAPTTITLASSPAQSNATLVLRAVAIVTLQSSPALSSATLDLTAPSTGTQTSIARVALSEVETPLAGTQTLRIRARASSGSGVLRTWLYDSDGTTIRGGPTDFTLTGSFQTFTLNPTGITDYSELEVAFQGLNPAGALTAEVSWVELAVPESAGAAPAIIPLDPAAGVSAATLTLRAAAQVGLQSSVALSAGFLTLTAPATIPLGTAAAVSTTTLALAAVPRVALQTAAATSSATLALTAQARLTLQTSAAVSSATLNLAQFVLLQSSTATSAATLALTAPTRVTLQSAAASSTATLALAAKPTIALASAAATSSASLTMTAAALLTLQADTVSSATLNVYSPSGADLASLTAVAVSFATLELFTAETEVLLATAQAVTTTTLEVTAQTQIPLDPSSAQSSATLAVRATTQVPLQPSAAVSAATLSLTVPARPSLATAAAASTATVAVTARSLLVLLAEAQSSATLELRALTRVALEPAVSVSTASLDLTILGPFVPEVTHPDLGGAFDQALTSGVVDPVPTGGVYDQQITGGAVTAPTQGGIVTTARLTSGEVADPIRSSALRGPNGGDVAYFSRSGVVVATPATGGVVRDAGIRSSAIDQTITGGDVQLSDTGASIGAVLVGAAADDSTRSGEVL